jgi:hypothetical protein
MLPPACMADGTMSQKQHSLFEYEPVPSVIVPDDALSTVPDDGHAFCTDEPEHLLPTVNDDDDEYDATKPVDVTELSLENATVIVG